MFRHRIVTGPSVILVAQPQLNTAGIQQFAEEQSLSDLPKLFAETPIGRILDHVALPQDEREFSDGEMLVEFAGRQCYRAWKQGRETPEYIQNILETQHGSVLAHAHFSFQISGISRGLSIELNRHSAGVDISQESQRFVDAADVCFVVPPALLEVWDGDIGCDAAQRWYSARNVELQDYLDVQEQVAAHAKELGLASTLRKKRANEAARYSLPNACETMGVWTFNYRSLRHIINLRGDVNADLEIRRLAANLAMQCKLASPAVFYDVEITAGDFGVGVVKVKHEKP